MGEQTQVQMQTQFQSPPPPPPDSSPPPPTPVTDEPDSNSSVSAQPSKIPIRPQKIRKLSSSPDSVMASSQPAGIPNPRPLQPMESSYDSTSTASPAQSTTTPNRKIRRRTAAEAHRVVPQIITSLSADGEIEAALLHLRSVDPLLATVIDTHPLPAFESNQPPFLSLTKSILYQQLAYKAGATIYNRFVHLCGGENEVRPESVLALSTQQLKQVGVSARKASYLYDLAHKYLSGILSDHKVVKMDDRSLFTMLSMVKGIGSWSVHMFMIFSLHRPDVLPVSDLGVRKGVQYLYGLDELPKPSQMEDLCEKWKPYRSVGAWYMWRLVEGRGTGQSADAAMQLAFGGVQPLQHVVPQQDLQQQQHQLHVIEPINGLGNLGDATKSTSTLPSFTACEYTTQKIHGGRIIFNIDRVGKSNGMVSITI